MNCVSILLQNSTSLTNNKRRNKKLVSQNIELGMQGPTASHRRLASQMTIISQ